jgi:N-acetylmuramic acid 6-phosphate (MurNAc-6-P) etherase
MDTVRNDPGLGELVTEAWDPAHADLDLRSTSEFVALMNDADATVAAAVARAHDGLVSAIDAIADHDVAVVVGGELIAGSTRLKAGTAQKLVLNTISTVTMVRVGKTFGNLTVDVVATNEKLRGRVRRIVGLATAEADDRVDEALRAAGGDAKVAIVSLLAGIDADSARERLARAQGVVRKALES